MRLHHMVAVAVAASALIACEDATGPSGDYLPQANTGVGSSPTGRSADAALSSHLVITGSPVTYAVNLGVGFSSLTQVDILFTFGSDPLDPGDCLHYEGEPMVGGGVCNPGSEPQTYRLLTYPCSIFPEFCAAFLDGVSTGQLTAGRSGSPETGSVILSAMTVTAHGAPLPATVNLDVRPGTFPNRVNVNGNGLIPVAVLTTPLFDATTIDPASVRFGPSAAREAHPRGHVEDVDRDGDLDLLLHFAMAASGIACGDTSAVLAGATFAGDSVRGSDGIELLGCSGPDLIVSAITIPTSTIVYGAAPPTWISFSVQNVGDTPISGALLRGTIVNMTKDGVGYDIGGYFRISYSEPLGPGQVVTHQFAVGHDAVWPPAHYELQVKVDDIDAIAESDETNNVSSRISFDVVAPAVSLSAITLSGTQLAIGASGGDPLSDLGYTGVITNATGAPIGTGFSPGQRAVLQHWVVQGSAIRAAGGWLFSPCYGGGDFGVIPPGSCAFEGAAYSPNNTSSAGTGILAAGPALLRIEVWLQDTTAGTNTVIGAHEVPISLVAGSEP